MSDSYQAVYDAVRSRISPCDVGSMVSDAAFRAFDISFAREIVQQEICYAASQAARPSVLYSPTLSADGSMWCALLGDDLQIGIAGFGETPAEAMAAFDKAFLSDRTPTAIRLARIEARSDETENTGSARQGESRNSSETHRQDTPSPPEDM
jgi:hypothetical protein